MGPPSARNAPANYAADAVAELKLSDSSHDGTAASAELNRVSAGNGYTQVPQLPGYDQLGAHTTFTHTSSSSGADPSYVSPGHTSAAPGQSSSGRSTPRSTNGQTSSQWSHKNGYTLSPSPHLQGETIRSESASGMPTNHTYSASNGGVPPKGMPSTYPSQLAGNKRRRDTSNDSVEAAQLARRKNVRENSTSSILNESFDDSNLSRPRSIIAALH